MKTLFNDEIEHYTRDHSTIKLTILGIAVFVGAVFIGWLISNAPHIISIMDIVAN